MTTRSLLALLATFVGCFTMAVSAEVDKDTRRYSLKHVEANAALRMAFESLSALDNAHAPIQEGGKPVPLNVTVGSTKLTSDPRTNSLTIVSTDSGHLEFLEKFLKAIDTKPTTFRISAVLLEIGLGDDVKQATDVLDLVDSVTVDGVKVSTKKISDDPNLSNEQREKAFVVYANAIGDLEQCDVLARPSIFLQNGDPGTLRVGNDGNGNELSVTATAHPDKTIALDLEWKDLTNKQTLESTVEVPNFAVTILGGLIRQGNGAKKERMMLLQAAMK